MSLNLAMRSAWGLVLVLSLAASASAQWGTVKGRFVYKGTPPVPKKLEVNKDQAVCTKHHPVDETILVDKDGGLANVFVYSREKGLKVHPEYEATAKDKVEVDNKFCRYSPRCSVLRTSQTLLLKNTDSVPHNVKADTLKNGSINVLIPPNGEYPQEFTKAETLPSTVGCSIHPWMSGYVLIRDDPYMTVSDEDGLFEIKNLPVGEVELQLWQEAGGYLDGAIVQGKPVKKGRLKVNVKAGVLDLGDIIVDAKLLKK